jgi:predicted ATP-grasp superfamily ATP-dependent carboligase
VRHPHPTPRKSLLDDLPQWYHAPVRGITRKKYELRTKDVPPAVDFPYLLYADQLGEQVERKRAKAGMGWLRMVTDVPVAASDLAHGYLSFGAYLTSLRNTRTESVFSSKDPLPWVAEFALLPYLIAKKYLKRKY